MKTKINFKTLLVVAILLITMCVFNANVVQAMETKQDETTTNTDTETSTVKTKATDTTAKEITTTEVDKTNNTKTNTDTKTETTKVTTETKAKAEPNKDTLNLIPNTMTVSIKEIEFQKLKEQGNELEKAIRKILADNNVDMTNYTLDMKNYTLDATWESLSEYDIHKFTVSIRNTKDITVAEKTITVKYSNTDNYNENDKKAIQNIMNKTGYFWLSETKEEREHWNPDFMVKWQKLINQLMTPFGSDVKCVALDSPQVWAGDCLSATHLIREFYFKDDVFYGGMDGEFTFSYEIIIPEDVRDTEKAYINYAKEYLKNNLNYDVSSFTIKYNEVRSYYEIFDGEECIDWIDIHKKDVVRVCDGITISSNANVTLKAETIKNDNATYSEMQKLANEKGYTNIFNAYELKLSSGTIGKDGLTLRFDVGTENNGKQAIVLHKKQDGTIEEFVKTVENGRISINVTELSPFMVAVKDSDTSSSNGSNSSNGKRLDDEPKTGVTNYAIISSIMALISLGGIIKH